MIRQGVGKSLDCSDRKKAGSTTAEQVVGMHQLRHPMRTMVHTRKRGDEPGDGFTITIDVWRLLETAIWTTCAYEATGRMQCS